MLHNPQNLLLTLGVIEGVFSLSADFPAHHWMSSILVILADSCSNGKLGSIRILDVALGAVWISKGWVRCEYVL